MSLVANIVVESRRYSGWLDPRFPIGFWQAAVGIAGDASGGFLALELLFQAANGPTQLNSQMYSVERLSATSTNGSGEFVKIQTQNMGGPTNLAFSQAYTFRLELVTGQSELALAAGDMSILPWFLGQQRTAGQSTSLSLVTSNPNGEVVTFEAEGYRWSPRSVLVDGGPQRPPTGLYRA